MAAGKITKRTVDALKPEKRDAFLWDIDCRGFGVKRTPAGKAVFLVQYRMHGGRSSKTKRYTIGPMGVWTPDSARDEAERLLRSVAQGVDPVAEKKRKRLEARELAFNAYADRFIANGRSRRGDKWADRTRGFVKSVVDLHLKPALGDTPVPEISRTDALRLLDNIPGNQSALRRNCFVVLRRILNWAVSREDITINPLAGMEAPASVESRNRVLDDDEIIALFKGSQSVAYPFGPFVRLLTITGQRRNEVAGMDWRELSRTDATWLVPSSRTKNGMENLLPLPRIAIDELDELAGGETWPKRGLIFSTTGETSISGYSKGKRRIDAAMLEYLKEEDDTAELDAWRYHDLRRTMATCMQKLAILPGVIEACKNRLAGRSKAGSASTYQRHDYAPEKREAMDKWGGFLTALLSDDDNVFPLAKAS